MAETVSPQTQEVLDYIAQHNLTDKLNDAVNVLCKSRPEDPFSFLAAELLKLSSPKITKVVGREVLDSRGNPTVEVDIYGNGRLLARQAAPSGASTGSNEALELRDQDEKRYRGKGVTQAVANVNNVFREALKGADVTNLRDIDQVLCKADGTELKTKLGGNAVTATSFAAAAAGATSQNKELFLHFAETFHGKDAVPEKFSLPVPMVNILNGGKHAGGDLKIQEFMILPKRGVTFKEALRMSAEVYHQLGKVLIAKYGKSSKNVGDEGGFAPSLKDADEALNSIEEAIQKAGYTINEDIFLALDCAASEFYDNEKKRYEIAPGKFLDSVGLVDYYAGLVERHPALISIEDGMDEKDYEGWIQLTAKLGDKCMSVGDDLYTTNTNLIKQGIEKKWANSLLLKVNQIGTISEAMDAAKMMYAVGSDVIVSHRSGETPGSLIADLAVGIGARFIKTGATARGERISKYNRLLQIEEFLQENSRHKTNA